MKAVVVYDSVYGNTEIIARAIGEALPGEVPVLRVGEVDAGDLQTLDLLIIGILRYGLEMAGVRSQHVVIVVGFLLIATAVFNEWMAARKGE